MVLSYLLRPKQPQPQPPSLQDFKLPTADEARPIPVVFGTVRITGANVVWYGDLGTQPVKTSTGKK